MARRSRKPSRRHDIHLYILEAILIVVLLIEGYKFIRFLLETPHAAAGMSVPVSSEP
jgi:hypothetical protein